MSTVTNKKPKPILMNKIMANLVHAGNKTMTRRPVIPQPPIGYECDGLVLDSTANGRVGKVGWSDGRGKAHFVRPAALFGDTLWVRETFWHYGKYVVVADKKTKTGKPKTRFLPIKNDSGQEGVVFEPPVEKPIDRFHLGWHKRPSLFMPFRVCRSFLRVTSVHIERVQAITESDADREGMPIRYESEPMTLKRFSQSANQFSIRGEEYELPKLRYVNPVWDFAVLWNQLYKKSGYGWDSNPYVFVYEFELMNVDTSK